MIGFSFYHEILDLSFVVLLISAQRASNNFVLRSDYADGLIK